MCSWIFSQRICYLEWWFKNNSQDYSFDPGNRWWDYTPDKCFKLRRRNLSLSLELSEADCIVTPAIGNEVNCLLCLVSVVTSFMRA